MTAKEIKEIAIKVGIINKTRRTINANIIPITSIIKRDLQKDNPERCISFQGYPYLLTADQATYI